MATKLSKRVRVIREKVQPGKVYPIGDAIELLKACATAKFVESFDVSINLGVDSRKSDQSVRGAVVLPHGTGKRVRVAVFADGEAADQAKEAGADLIGMDDLADQILKGEFNFDVVIATPSSMRVVGKLGQVLGPRGLMPNPKVGTVTQDVGGAVRNAKAGQARFRTDKSGLVHCSIGKINFEVVKIKENLEALLVELKRVKPAAAKGTYLKKITVSTTMGPGLMVDQSTVTV